MKNIVIVTLYRNNNYGSNLQCYALQTVIKKMGFNPITLYQSEKGCLWQLKRIVRKIQFVFSLILYPLRLKTFKKHYLESGRSVESFGENAEFMMNQFVEKRINDIDISYRDAKKMVNKENLVCISGSDQVWSLNSPFLNPFLFLRFAPKKLRHSYAASFGTDFCPNWFKHKLKKYLKDFTSLSIRENTGQEIVKKYVGCNARIDIDPVLLLTNKEWKNLFCNNELVSNERFAFLYFLNEPSNEAIEHINILIKQIKITQVFYTPYKSDKIESTICYAKYKELSPEDYLNHIDNASFISTDSFHGGVFSAIFNKEFYVYRRNYSNGISQNNRIETFLKRYRLSNQYINDDFESRKIPDYSYFNKIVGNDQKSAYTYLKDCCGAIDD